MTGPGCLASFAGMALWPLVRPPLLQVEVFFLMIVFMVLGLAVAILIAVWVYKDAKSRGMDAAIWLLVVLLAGLIGLIVYLVIRKDHPVGGYQLPPGYYYAPPPGYADPYQQQYSPYDRTYQDQAYYYDVPDYSGGTQPGERRRY